MWLSTLRLSVKPSDCCARGTRPHLSSANRKARSAFRCGEQCGPHVGSGRKWPKVAVKQLLDQVDAVSNRVPVHGERLGGDVEPAVALEPYP